MTTKICEAFDDTSDVLDEDGNNVCGKPAVAKYMYEDGSAAWLCATCLDFYVECDKEDMEEFAGTPRGVEAEKMLRANGYL